jgi:GTP-binding protein
MVVGENTKENDVEVDITKERKSHAARPSPGADVMRIIPPRSMSLEHALEFIRDDEVVEVTPWGLRLRKKVLQAARRLNP